MEKTCPTCGGTGQIGYFQGVSRFLLSWEECPRCGGTGYCPDEKPARPEQKKNAPAPARGSGGKKKTG